MTDVGQTFQSHAVLLTGGNGFLGKVILAYLLDRFPDLKHLYVLLRPKFDLSAAERFYEETLASPALAEIAARRGEKWLRKRITVLGGDVGAPNCGLDATLSNWRAASSTCRRRTSTATFSSARRAPRRKASRT